MKVIFDTILVNGMETSRDCAMIIAFIKEYIRIIYRIRHRKRWDSARHCLTSINPRICVAIN